MHQPSQHQVKIIKLVSGEDIVVTLPQGKEQLPDNAALIRLEKPLLIKYCLLYTSPSPRDKRQSRMPSTA